MPTLNTLAVEREIEQISQRPVGRDIGLIARASRGGLGRAARAISAQLSYASPTIVLVSGFYIPSAAAAETDGPLGVAHLVRGLSSVGFRVRVLTDSNCERCMVKALEAAGCTSATLDVVETTLDIPKLEDVYRDLGVSCILSVERPGPGIDGETYDMKGIAIGSTALSLEPLFAPPKPWVTIAIGDGGNEIGMGNLPVHLIAESIDHGRKIACRVPCDHLIVSGVSNWGAVALLATVSVIRPDIKQPLLNSVNATDDQRILAQLVHEGRAVDGVTKQHDLSVDGLPWPEYWRTLDRILAVVEGHHR